ncbi:MAG TPA: hypothetical protein VNH40_11505, partial [Gaiellaceae bacterium]|nr:hypothetical protein [Gaiellaceae bacterium]
RVPMSAVTTAFVGALLLTLEMWLTGDLTGAPADLAALFVRGQVNGLEWALGFDHGQFSFQPPPG